ncbi:outer membrane beta-barrel protein [Chitinophaga sp. Mgbs1]|uniref:Outer membrane beta-barrel protein n=1 Tax=Chitinophaga solisilvae TaxID=1233460 RepID=A0A3S1CWB7_9BACT|nr:outer membrane beta-barrel protein [Chitinophaga solisilvae]
MALPFISLAQDWHVGAFVGITNYSGDLVKQKVDLKYTRPALGLLVRRDINRYLSIRGAFTWGIVTGADSTSSDKALLARNLSFKSNVFEGSLIAELNFLDIEEKNFTPYVFLGVGGFGFDPFAKDLSGNKVRLRPLGTEGQGLPEYPGRQPYDLFSFSFPFGAGVKAILNDHWTLGFEIGLRPTLTDYLDDVSTNYVDQNTLLAYRGQKSVDMAYRGDEVSGKLIPGIYPRDGEVRGSAKYKDWYSFSGVTITYRLGGSSGWGRQKAMRCPVFR